jgi:hypothetical protein
MHPLNRVYDPFRKFRTTFRNFRTFGRYYTIWISSVDITVNVTFWSAPFALAGRSEMLSPAGVRCSRRQERDALAGRSETLSPAGA